MTWAAADPGSSVNACAIAAIDVTRAGLWAPCYLAEQSGIQGHPLDLRNVLVPHARALRALGCGSWKTDGFALHDVQHAGWDAGLHTEVEGHDLWERWRDLRAVVARGLWSLAPHPRLPREQWPLLDVLAGQLATVLEKIVGNHRTIVLPTVGTSHGDLASAYARAFHHAKAGNWTPDVDDSRGRVEADDGIRYAEY